MKFRASFCDPFNPKVIELGEIEKDKIIELFEKTAWVEYLEKVETAKDTDIYYSPSLEVENKDTRHGLSLSAVGDPSNYEFYIFYKRPKRIKTFFGLSEKLENDYMTDVIDQSRESALECLTALINNDTQFLENRIGK